MNIMRDFIGDKLHSPTFMNFTKKNDIEGSTFCKRPRDQTWREGEGERERERDSVPDAF